MNPRGTGKMAQRSEERIFSLSQLVLHVTLRIFIDIFSHYRTIHA
jgi:hypothetical protein